MKNPVPLSPVNHNSAESLLQGLNPQQLAAVTYRGPALLVVAGAGSGKTRVLTHRIAHLLATGDAWPSQILAITFTNKAAGEMRDRVRELLGGEADGMWISTFHSACVRILRAEAEAFGYPQGFSIYDSSDSRALLKRIIKDLDADSYGFTPARAQGRISKLKNELIDSEEFARSANFADPKESLFAQIFNRYTSALADAKAFDFDDLIAQVVYLFRGFPQLAAKYRRRFRHILIDEYQDTNHAQYSLVREFTRAVDPEDVIALGDQGLHVANLIDRNGSIPPASLTVVGDSDQSIYAFRGADIRNITEFERDFSGAEVVLLEQNYRSTQTILDAANAVIGNNFDRTAKNLWSDAGTGETIIGYTGYSGHDEAQFVADRITELHGEAYGYNQMAVFYRTNSQTRALEEILIRSGIPYRILGGTKFYERAEIKDLLAYLSVAVNPSDDLALRRILNTPKRGIGPATEATLAVHAEKSGVPLALALGDATSLGFGPKLRQAIADLDALLKKTAALALTANSTEVLMEILNSTGYLELLKNSPDPQEEARAENVEELVAVTREFHRNNPESTLLDFLTEAALVAAADDLDDASGTVSLMTLHTAKGLEYDVVFITGVEDGLLPHAMSFEEPGGLAEERRLFYVGITRARKFLHLSLALTRAQYGGVEASIGSRFLDEIPANLIEWRGSNRQSAGRAGFVQIGREVRNGSGYQLRASERSDKPRTTWEGQITQSKLRDNKDLTLAAGDRISHSDFGEGLVVAVTGEGAKSVAEVNFDSAGKKKLLIKIAPITKL